VKSFPKPRKSENRFTQKTGRKSVCPVCEAQAATAQRTRAACFQALDTNASQKTGLTIRIQNGWRDFRFREKVSERQEIEKRFQVENQGFRVAWVREWRVKLSLLRLDLRVERGTCTGERKET